jgi:hypothetical protein
MSQEDEADREKTGTFLVTHVDEGSAVLRDVHDAEVHTLEETRDLDAGEVLEATLTAAGPMGVVWSIVAVEARGTIPVERSPESPTANAVDIAGDQAVGEVTTRERAGEGELHILTVPPAETDSAAADVVADEETVARAARLGVDRVEVRADDGVVSVRYLPA